MKTNTAAEQWTHLHQDNKRPVLPKWREAPWQRYNGQSNLILTNNYKKQKKKKNRNTYQINKIKKRETEVKD